MRTRVAAARQWSGNGIAAIKRGAMREARECFARASKQTPGDHRIVANVARTHFQEGEIDKAIEVMQQAVELNESSSSLRIELGEYYLANGQPEQASRQMQTCLEIDHRNASAWMLKGKISAVAGDHKAALGDFQKSLGIDGTREDVKLLIVETYRKLGDPLRALAAVEQLLEKYPVDQQPQSAVLAKSAALVELNQLNAAAEVLQKGSQSSDASMARLVGLASAQLRSGQRSEAMQTLERAGSGPPSDAKVAMLTNGRSSNAAK